MRENQSWNNKNFMKIYENKLKLYLYYKLLIL